MTNNPLSRDTYAGFVGKCIRIGSLRGIAKAYRCGMCMVQAKQIVLRNEGHITPKLAVKQDARSVLVDEYVEQLRDTDNKEVW